MPRNEQDYLDIHRAADRVEPRLARSVAKAGVKLRARIPVAALTEALEAEDYATAGILLDQVDVADAYVPAGRIVADTVLVGGKLAAKDINEELD